MALQPEDGMKLNPKYYHRDEDGSTTVSFLLSNDLYEKLCNRLPKHGSRSDFFRTIVEQFLDGKFEVVQERKF